MNYEVLWKPAAERQLTALWKNAADQEVVAAAVEALDADLTRDPYSVGESRGGMMRFAFYEPLSARFEIVEDDRRVWVIAIWRPQR